MSIVKADDVCHVRFAAPDLPVMQEFLEDFGLLNTGLNDGALYMRGHDANPFCHVTQRGEPRFIGFGLRVNSREDLERIARHDGVGIEPFNAPGGGEVVQLTDPDGFGVEVVFGQQPAVRVAVSPTLERNENGAQRRLSEFQRIGNGPSHVLRLGHVVLSVSDFRQSEAWYKDRFGLITSDEIQPAPGVGIGAFMRVDRGDVPSDHHTIFLFQHPAGPRFLHAAFEVADLDDLMAGRDYLLARQRTAVWGVGRHILGSQIFDYWNDPWGNEIEHWTDGDQLRARDGGNIASLETLMSVQWGMNFPGGNP